jgi:uncharacterized protein (TIGR02996 family)
VSSKGDELLAAIADNRDDAQLVSVYADWLTEQGDARGEVITLGQRLDALAKDDPARAPIEARWKKLTLAKHFPGRIQRQRHGVVERMTIDVNDDVTRLVVALPIVLRELDFSIYFASVEGNGGPPDRRLTRALERLDTRWLERIEVYVASDEAAGRRGWSPDRLLETLTAHAAALPRLRSVEVHASRLGDEAWRAFLSGPLGARFTNVSARGIAERG